MTMLQTETEPQHINIRCCVCQRWLAQIKVCDGARVQVRLRCPLSYCAAHATYTYENGHLTHELIPGKVFAS